MQSQTVHIASEAIRYMEDHLSEKPELNRVAAALHYSPFYLHRIFTKTVGMTIRDYGGRRRLTEAARLLAFTKRPIMEIALISGYESQQAFTGAFKGMYKTTPAKFRETEEFYPLQMEIHLKEGAGSGDLTKDHIRFAVPADADAWMELVGLAIDGYPCFNEREYAGKLYRYMADKQALILRDRSLAAGAMAFSPDGGNIDFLAVHPQYRSMGVTELFLDKLRGELLRGRDITLTTYRAGDKADTGYRREYCRLGFAERELVVEYGYPAQKLVLSSRNKEEAGRG